MARAGRQPQEGGVAVPGLWPCSWSAHTKPPMVGPWPGGPGVWLYPGPAPALGPGCLSRLGRGGWAGSLPTLTVPFHLPPPGLGSSACPRGPLHLWPTSPLPAFAMTRPLRRGPARGYSQVPNPRLTRRPLALSHPCPCHTLRAPRSLTRCGYGAPTSSGCHSPHPEASSARGGGCLVPGTPAGSSSAPYDCGRARSSVASARAP